MTKSRPRHLFTNSPRFSLAKAAAGVTTLAGYACVWNVLSKDRGGYSVRLLPGSARFTTPTLALWHHDYRYVVGNTANGTLRIKNDSYGAKVEIDLPATTTGRDVAELVRKAYVGGMSFAVVDYQDSRDVTERGRSILEVAKFTADEVTITAIPAFDSTTIAVKRATDQAFATTPSLRGHHEHVDAFPSPIIYKPVIIYSRDHQQAGDHLQP